MVVYTFPHKSKLALNESYDGSVFRIKNSVRLITIVLTIKEKAPMFFLPVRQWRRCI